MNHIGDRLEIPPRYNKIRKRSKTFGRFRSISLQGDILAGLLPVGYFHVVFTLPAEVAAIAFHNKALVNDLLLRTASERELTIAADRKHLGARIGITAVIHTWGRR